jgi:hypothetical protein
MQAARYATLQAGPSAAQQPGTRTTHNDHSTLVLEYCIVLYCIVLIWLYTCERCPLLSRNMVLLIAATVNRDGDALPSSANTAHVTGQFVGSCYSSAWFALHTAACTPWHSGQSWPCKQSPGLAKSTPILAHHRKFAMHTQLCKLEASIYFSSQGPWCVAWGKAATLRDSLCSAHALQWSLQTTHA